jgi:hypothetical protein
MKNKKVHRRSFSYYKKKWHVDHASDMTYGLMLQMGMQRDKFINDFHDFFTFSVSSSIYVIVYMYILSIALDRICCMAMDA